MLDFSFVKVVSFPGIAFIAALRVLGSKEATTIVTRGADVAAGGSPGIMPHEAREYRSEMDLIAQWLDDVCSVGAGLTTSGPIAYASFQNWCKQNGSAPVSNLRFSQKLVERGFSKTRTSTARGWDGLSCRQLVLTGLA